ncbi:MAG: hypothetical protein ACRC62_23455, partial [Microcoleus sp.]
DGTKTDFSYRCCVSEKAATQKQRLNKAARAAIHPQIREFRLASLNDDGDLMCAVSGLIKCPEFFHVDHYPVAFADLLDQYLAFSGLDIDKIQFVEDSSTCRFADPRLEKDFSDWHLENAELRIVESWLNEDLGRHDKKTSMNLAGDLAE